MKILKQILIFIFFALIIFGIPLLGYNLIEEISNIDFHGMAVDVGKEIKSIVEDVSK